jgi:anaerobic selenocysteine-containing dehydrogenase
VGLHIALTPTWSESAFFADYVLPVGVGSERHDLHSYETHDAQWIGFRQPVLKEARERLGQKVGDTREVNPGEVWEENELWIDLSWRIDPDGALGIRKHFESRREPGAKLTVDEYYAFIFENSVPGPAREGARLRADAARVHAALRRLRGLAPGRRAARGPRARGRARGRAAHGERARLRRQREAGFLQSRTGTVA